MTDEIELESISGGEEDACADAPAPDDARTDAIDAQEQLTTTAGQETRRHLQPQGTMATPGPANAATGSARSTLQSPPSARAELDPADCPPRDEVQGNFATPASSVATRNHQSSIQLRAGDTRTEVVQRRSRRNGSHSTQRQESVLIDDPPPPYPGPSSTSYTQHTQSHIYQRHSHPHHSPMQASRTGHSHVISLQHNSLPLHSHQHQHCSLMHGNSNCHHSISCTECAHGYHHPPIVLPGETQPCLCDHMPRQTPHSTILPSHYRGSDQQENQGANDYLTLSFLCVVLCTLHLNLPALLCVLPALAYSIKAHQLNNERMARRASTYGRAALLCNLLAFCQYLIFLVAVASTVSVFFVLGVNVSL